MIFPKTLNTSLSNYIILWVSIAVHCLLQTTLKGGSKMTDNNVFIGGKPFMNYVTGVVMQFTTKNADDVIIKARGKFISRAVDVAEVTAKRFLENSVAVSGIKIDSEGFRNTEGRDVRVSTIEITLSKNR